MTTSPLAARSERLLYEFDAFKVDPVRRRLLKEGSVVPLTPKAFSILLILIENHGEVVEKEELIRGVWGDAYVTEANLTQNVSSLRKALGERANDHRFVVTVPGRGYSFVAEVAEVPRDPTGEFPALNLPTPSPPVQALDESGVFRMPTPSPAPSLDDSGVFRMPPPALDDTGSFRLPPAVASPPPAAPQPVKGRRRFLLAGLALGFLFAAAVAGLYITYKERSSRAVPAAPRAGEAAEAARPPGFRRTVAVLGFRNLSGDRRKDWLATALAEMLTTELSAGSKVR